VEHGILVADPARDILKAVVVERHRASGRLGVGFVHGTGITRGAFCTSVAPPAHPLVAAGCSDHDIHVAISRVVDMQGGMALVVDGKVIESVPLPVGGVLSTATIEDTADRLERLESACWDLGCELAHPASSLGALANLHLPALRLSERGLVDTDEGTLVPLQDDH